MMVVITVGNSYVDIDGYASAIAYRELLNMQGIDAKFVSNANLNYSVTKSLKNIQYDTDKYEIKDDDEFIILDLSDKSYFPNFVKENSIIEIIDHHPGFKDYWNNKLGNKSIIEEIGAVATIIVEKYEQSSFFDKINNGVARLLMAAILDNTLNFTASITTDRDITAYKKLESIVNDHNYAKTYFNEVQEYIENNLETSIKNDIKTQYVNDHLPDVFGQLTVWDAKRLDNNYISDIMNNYGNKWMVNIISLCDNTSYIIYSSEEVKYKLIQLLNCYENDGLLIMKTAMLRKEIMKKALL